MATRKHPGAVLKFVGGRTCLDFVNSVGGRGPVPPSERGSGRGYRVISDNLDNYAALVAWSEHASLLTATEAGKLLRASRLQEDEAASVLTRAIALREGIYRIFKAIIDGSPPRPSDLDVLNREVTVANGRAKLAPGDGRFVWEWTGTQGSLDRMLWPIVDSAAEFLTSGDLSRLRECGGEDCGWLFEDTSKNRSRQWCDMRDCGNLAKVHRFRSRVRSRRTSQKGPT